MRIKINGEFYLNKENLLFNSKKNNETFQISGEGKTQLLKIIPFLSGTLSLGEICDILEIEYKEVLTLFDNLESAGIISYEEKEVKKITVTSGTYPISKIKEIFKNPVIKNILEIKEIDDVLHADLVVVIDKEDDVDFYKYSSDKLKELNIPWLKASIGDSTISIGPIFFQDGGPCYQCYEERKKLNEVSEKEKLKLISTYMDAIECLPFFLEGELLNYINEGKPSGLFEQEVKINIPAFTIDVHPIFKLPNCSYCRGEFLAI